MARSVSSADVVVAGGGLAGLAAALGFARRGRRVVVLERDPPLPGGGADAAFDLWGRPGIAHFRQPHNFLGLARGLLLREAPDVLERVVELGALENRQYELLPGPLQPGDEAFVALGARRPVFELALREAAEAEPNITLTASTRVLGLLAAESAQDRAVRVTGVRTSGGDVSAELVVDALGRTSSVPAWLVELGARPPLERRSECGLLYYSRHFRFHERVEVPLLPTLLRGPRAEIGYLAFAVFVGDNRTFALVMMIPTWDRELRALRFEQAYMAAALAMPALVPWVHPDQSEPITHVLPMGSLQNLHRSLVVDGAPVASGVQPIGDALCHTNPSFAYGASLSLKHGFTLADIADRHDDPKGRALAFDHAVGADAADRFDAVAAEDRDRLRLWRGEPLDVGNPDDSLALFLRMTVYTAAAHDADIFRAVAGRVNLLEPASALGKNQTLVERARRLTTERGAPSPGGPPRDELLKLVSAASPVPAGL